MSTAADFTSDPRIHGVRVTANEIIAHLADGRVIAGTADRLLIENAHVSVLDFKTGRVPESDMHIPAAHRAQMDAYAAALRVIFPGRHVRAALLYTAGPKLIEVMP